MNSNNEMKHLSITCKFKSILGDPGAGSQDDAKFSGERYFGREFKQKRVSSAPEVYSRPKTPLARKYCIVPANSAWVFESGSQEACFLCIYFLYFLNRQ